MELEKEYEAFFDNLTSEEARIFSILKDRKPHEHGDFVKDVSGWNESNRLAVHMRNIRRKMYTHKMWNHRIATTRGSAYKQGTYTLTK